MNINVNIKLNAGQGAGLGPTFNLTADYGEVTPSTATLIELRSTDGKVVEVDYLASIIYVTAADGACLGSPALALSITGKPVIISAYRGYTASTIKSRTDVPDQVDMKVVSTMIQCFELTTAKIAAALGVADTDIETLSNHANVNRYSGFGPTSRAESGGLLVNSVGAPYSVDKFAGYNHTAPVPAFNNSIHLNDIWVSSGGEAIFTADITIGEPKFIGGDITNHGNCIGICLTIWDGANLAGFGYSDTTLAQAQNAISLSASVLNCILEKTYTCKIYLTDSTTLFNQNGDNIVCQLSELADYQTTVKIKAATNLSPAGYVGWTLVAPGLNVETGHVAFTSAQRNSNATGLTIKAHILDWLGNLVTDDIILYGPEDYVANTVLGAEDHLVWILNSIAKNLPIPAFGYVCHLEFEEST